MKEKIKTFLYILGFIMWLGTVVYGFLYNFVGIANATLINHDGKYWSATSLDTKPTGTIKEGKILIETDTKTIFIMPTTGGTWTAIEGVIGGTVEWLDVQSKPTYSCPTGEYPSEINLDTGIVTCATDSTGNGSMTYPSAGVPLSTGSSWSTSYSVGTNSNNLVQLDGNGALPAVDGSNLTNVTASALAEGMTFTGDISGFTANRALVSSDTGSIVESATTSTEVGYLSGVTSTIQTQLNAKVSMPTSTGIMVYTGGTTTTTTSPDIGTATGTSLVATGIIDGLTVVSITTDTTNGVESPQRSQIYTFNNITTVSTAVTYTLPTAASGKQRCYGNYTSRTGVIRIDTSAAGQYIDLDGVNTSSGGYVTSGGALGDKACLVGASATQWMMYVSKGTWTTN